MHASTLMGTMYMLPKKSVLKKRSGLIFLPYYHLGTPTLSFFWDI